MPQYNEAVIIDGTQDEVQLQVQGNSPQTEPLQTWETSAGDTLAQVTADGRFQIGSFESGMMATDDALIEAHRHENDTTKPKRGLHLLGEMTGVLDSLVSWVVQELVLKGSAAISGLHTTLRVRLRHASSGDSTAAELLAADIEAANATGTSTTRLGQLTGLRTTIVNGESGYVDQAIGLDVRVSSSNPDTQDAPINTTYGIRVGNIDQGADNYALYTGSGLVHLGDTLELQQQATDPATPPADVVRIYPKSDGKLYAKNDTGTEYDLTGGGGGGAGVPTGTVISYAGAAAPQDWLLCDGKALSRTAYADLFAVIGTAFNVRATLATRTSDSEGVFAFTDGNHGLAMGSAVFNLFWFNEVAKISSINTSTEVITTNANHYFTTGNRVWVSSTGNLPGGLSADTDYYVRVLSATTLSLHPTYNDAGADTNKINLTDAGTGTKLITPKNIASRNGLSITNVSGDLVTFSGGTGDTLPIVGTIHEIECLSEQFFLPDLRGRVAVGAGHSSGLSNRFLGDLVGEEDHTLTITELPSHKHRLLVSTHAPNENQAAGSNRLASGTFYRSTSPTGNSYNSMVEDIGGDAAHNNMQPSVTLNYIIKS